ncbi:MAG: hypothetical protein LR015_08220 [Verrucomicrobia bacterium]|nr:hypothetical protein [Verrucomicrobiota bacterium]
MYRNDPSTGRLFVSNVHNVPGGQQFRPDLAGWIIHDQEVHAFQYNPEMALPMLVMSGGSMWIFGAKFGERQGPMVYALDQAKVEIFGGVMNVSDGFELNPIDTSIFVVHDAQITVSGLERAVEINGPPNWNFRHRFIGDEVRDGERRRLATTDPIVVHRDTLSRAGPRGAGAVPLYTSRYAPDATSSAPEVQVRAPALAAISAGAFLQADVIAANGPGVPSAHWSRVSGPGEVSFDDPAAASTTVHFSRIGDYELGVRVRNGFHETFHVFPISVVLGERMEIIPLRGAFRRLDDRAPRNGTANSAIEALLLRTGDEAVVGQSQDTEVRIHSEIDLYRLRGAGSQIVSAGFRVTPRLLINAPDVTLHHVRANLFGRVTVGDFLHPTVPQQTIPAQSMSINQPVEFDLTSALITSLNAGEQYMGLQLRGPVNDDSQNNYVEWYSPDQTTARSFRPTLTVYGDTSGMNFLQSFADLGGTLFFHPAFGYVFDLGTGWLWSSDQQRFFYLAQDSLYSAWMWHPEGGWLWTQLNFHPWFYHHETESWLYLIEAEGRLRFLDVAAMQFKPW